MTKQEIEQIQKSALTQIEANLSAARKLIAESTKLADENGVSFHFHLSYMGHYKPHSEKRKIPLMPPEPIESIEDNDYDWDESEESYEEGWETSNC